MDKNQGYAILKAVMLENGRGFALGEHPTAPSPYVTWACYDDEHGIRQYEWGNYGDDLAAMENDLSGRVREYQRLYGVEVDHIEAPGLYKYYSTQRLVDIGTFPKPPHNAPDEIVNYDQRVPVEGGAFLAWGHLTYTKPLTEKAAADYELRPAPAIPTCSGGLMNWPGLKIRPVIRSGNRRLPSSSKRPGGWPRKTGEPPPPKRTRRIAAADRRKLWKTTL